MTEQQRMTERFEKLKAGEKPVLIEVVRNGIVHIIYQESKGANQKELG